MQGKERAVRAGQRSGHRREERREEGGAGEVEQPTSACARGKERKSEQGRQGGPSGWGGV